MKITIITPAYNAEKTIEKTLQSVLNQSYGDIEYIVVDGASKDNTLQIVRKYERQISKIISEPDNGIADAYNKGIRLATGDLIGIVAADDALLPGAIERLVSAYDGHSDVVAGGIVECDGVGYRLVPSQPDLKLLEWRTSLRHPATFIRKSAYLKYGSYDTHYKCAMDRELFLRYYKKTVPADHRYGYGINGAGIDGRRNERRDNDGRRGDDGGYIVI